MATNITKITPQYKENINNLKLRAINTLYLSTLIYTKFDCGYHSVLRLNCLQQCIQK